MYICFKRVKLLKNSDVENFKFHWLSNNFGVYFPGYFEVLLGIVFYLLIFLNFLFDAKG